MGTLGCGVRQRRWITMCNATTVASVDRRAVPSWSVMAPVTRLDTRVPVLATLPL